MHGFLVAEAFVAEHGLWRARASVAAARGFSSWASRTLEHRLNSCGPWPWLLRSMWDLPGSGSRPSLLHWQVDSSPSSHRGSPRQGVDRGNQTKMRSLEWDLMQHECGEGEVRTQTHTQGRPRENARRQCEPSRGAIEGIIAAHTLVLDCRAVRR